MNHLKAAACAVGALLLSVAPVVAASTPPSAKPSPNVATSSVQAKEVSGQHRGYTNDELYLRLDDGKEMTFLVRIPGDKDAKWHQDFETLSRITVTYRQGPNDKQPVAIAIRKAGPPKK